MDTSYSSSKSLHTERNGGKAMNREHEEVTVEKWVNLKDIAEHLSVSQDTVRTWIKEGKLPFYKGFRKDFCRIYRVRALLLIFS